jgi:pimeloyl-ACP methyl ester carboxylesterase
MGGWIALLLARELKRRATAGAAPAAALAGMVLIAPATDFTEELMWKKFSPAVKRQIEATGSWQRPSQYSEEPYVVTRGLIEEGRRHLLLGGLIETGCPVRILQGVQDPDVPWQHAIELSSRLAHDDVVLPGWMAITGCRGLRSAADCGGGRVSSVTWIDWMCWYSATHTLRQTGPAALHDT